MRKNGFFVAGLYTIARIQMLQQALESRNGILDSPDYFAIVQWQGSFFRFFRIYQKKKNDGEKMVDRELLPIFA